MKKNCREWRPRHSAKKWISLFLSLVLLLSVTAGLDFSANALSSSGSCGENVTYTFDSSTGLLTISGIGSITNYSSSRSPFYNQTSIKSVVINDSVTSIGNYSFQNCTGLTSIEIPSSVTSIGSYAFNCCSCLRSITIPNGVASIGNGTFYYCSGLTSIEIPDSVTSIGSSAFSGCSRLTSIDIPNGVKSIGDSAFRDCSGLKAINIPNSITSISNYVFDGCSGLTSIDIPNGVKSIGDSAFCYCRRLKIITIPSKVTSIGRAAFSYCSGLTSVKIPNSVSSISSGAFSHCSGLTSVKIPNSISSISSGAFDGCTGLTSVEIPNSVTSIGSYAFSGCSRLTSISIPNSITNIVYEAFENCSGLKNVYYSGTQSDWNNISIESYNDYLTNANLICNYKSNPNTPPCETHNWDSGAVTTQPNCVNIGFKTYICAVCGATYAEELSKTGIHTFDNGVITISPTCVSTGVKTFTCIDCGTSKTEQVAATGIHTYDNGVITTQPTCVSTGVKTFTCTVCGAKKTESVAATGVHTYNSGVITTQPTCTKTGVKTCTCTVCGDTKSETVAALGHDYVITERVEPTYTDGGYSFYECSRCNSNYEEFEEQLVLPFNTTVESQNNQTYKIKLDKSGYVSFDFVGDGRCRLYIYDKDEKYINELSTEYNEFFKRSYLNSNTDVSNAGNFNFIGLIAGEYYIKVDCSGNFEMSVGFESANESITKTKNTLYYDAPSAAGIEINKSYNGFLCEMSATDAYWFEIPEGYGNSKVSIEISVEPYRPEYSTFCTAVLYSSKSGQVEDFNYLYISGNEVKSRTVYLGEGKYYISVIRGLDSYPLKYTISAKAIPECKKHNYTSKVTKAATCTKAGVRTYTCTNCGESYTESIKALGHNYKTTIKKATPDKSGYVDNVCSRCKDTKHKYLAPVKAKLSITTYTYNGKAKKPSVTVYDSETGSSISKDYYTVTYPSGRKKIGTYTVKITLKGKYYSGTIKKSFKIVKKVTAPAKVTGVSGVMTEDYNKEKVTYKATWKKVSGAEGYQVQTAEDDPRGGKFWHTAKNISGGSKTSYTYNIAWATDESIDYVKVRAYKMADGKKIYGKWSKIVKTKYKKK